MRVEGRQGAGICEHQTLGDIFIVPRHEGLRVSQRSGLGLRCARCGSHPTGVTILWTALRQANGHLFPAPEVHRGPERAGLVHFPLLSLGVDLTENSFNRKSPSPALKVRLEGNSRLLPK